MMLNAFALLLLASVSSQPASVTNCGADPTGKFDSTPAFETCLASLPAGDLIIPYGTYRITRPIYKSRRQNLIGMGSRASVIKCESVNSVCIVAADTSGGPNEYTISSIRNLALEGPGVTNRSVGVLLGGDPDNKLISKTAFGDFVNLTDLRVKNFNHGIQWGNNAYANKVFHCAIYENGTALFAPPSLQNSGEAISITDSTIFNNRENGIEDHTNFEWMIQGTSFDYNVVAITFYGATIHAVNCHFEQPTSKIFFQPYGSADLSIRDSTILVQSNTGADTYILELWPQSLNLAIDDVSIWSNHPVKFFMKAQGNISGSINNLHGNGNKNIGALADRPIRIVVSATPLSQTN